MTGFSLDVNSADKLKASSETDTLHLTTGTGQIVGYEGSQKELPESKGRLREGKAFGSGEGRAMRSGTRREVLQGLNAFDRKMEF
jgi:hypothetical protein